MWTLAPSSVCTVRAVAPSSSVGKAQSISPPGPPTKLSTDIDIFNTSLGTPAR